MAVYALLNRDSGSLPEDADQLLADALSEAGHSAEMLVVDGGGMVDSLARQRFTQDDLLIVWGGDGTVACAIEHTGRHAPVLLPLPGGTMNLLHKRVHGGAVDWRDCLQRSLDAGHERWLAGGESQGRTFYVALMAGALTRLSEAREALRDGEVLGAARKAASNEAFSLETDLLLDPGDTEVPATAVGVFLKDGPDGPNFEIGIIDPENIMELVRIGLAAAIDTWQSVAGTRVFRSRRAELHSRSGAPIAATFDGEPAQLPAGFTVTLKERAARVLAAAPA